ncbi:MAG: response regulator [Candidatus Omnitrophota bacterium]
MEKKRILFVDDEESFARMMKLILEESGEYEIMIETRGLRVVDVAKEFKPDLILLDIVMPDIDGGEVLRKIKAEEKLKNTPLVFLTALVMENEIVSREGVISGYPFLAKPVTVDKLMDCIKENIREMKVGG